MIRNFVKLTTKSAGAGEEEILKRVYSLDFSCVLYYFVCCQFAQIMASGQMSLKF